MRLRIPLSTIRLFISFVVDDVTQVVISRNTKLDQKTIHILKTILFDCLSNVQDEYVLTNLVMIDEMYVPINEKKWMNRDPEGLKTSGLSFDQLCIITLIDGNSNGLVKVSGRASPNPVDYFRCFDGNVKNVHRFIYDAYQSSKQFMRRCLVPKHGKIVDGRPGKHDIYNFKLLDTMQSSLRFFLTKHKGFKLKYLQGYLDFFIYRYNFRSGKENKNKKEQERILDLLTDDLFKRFIKYTSNINYKNYSERNNIEHKLRINKKTSSDVQPPSPKENLSEVELNIESKVSRSFSRQKP